MALGVCMECGKLVAIVARGLKWGETRQKNWYPVMHDAPDGSACRGHTKAII